MTGLIHFAIWTNLMS